MKPMIVGEASPVPGAEPLSACRPGSTGWRLWKMLCAHAQCSADEYHAAFDRRNLCETEWYGEAAWWMSVKIRYESVAGVPMVLLGDKVQRTFGVPRGANPAVLRGRTYYCVPHPSGLNRWYNDPANRDHVGKLLALIYRNYKEKTHA